MSEKHVDNNVKQTPKGSVQVSTMGNLFSKEEDPEGHETQNDALPGEETRPDNPCSPPLSLLTDQDDFFKYFDKATDEDDPLMDDPTESSVLDSEKVILNAFLNEVRNAKPAPLKNWSALQHYVYFIYRHAISEKPCNSNEIFPNIITKKIRDLIESLLQEDFTQLCIRLVTLVREYAIVARGHFTNFTHPKLAAYIVSLMSYYSAFCSAASKLSPLLPEFDFLIMERFNVNWLCLNKSIFYHYVYMSPAVQAKIPLFDKLKDDPKYGHRNLVESYTCFSEDMTLICSRWNGLRTRISHLSHKRALSNPSKYLLSDWKMFEEQKKMLKTNYWMVRNTQAMQLQDMTELDGHIISVVGDTAYIADFLIDNQGHCMCEDCLAAEFRCSSVTIPVISSSFQTQSVSCRLITCYICQDPIALDALASHVVTKHHESHSQKSARVYLTPHQKRIPKKSSKGSDIGKSKEPFPFEGLFEKNLELKESLLKLVNGRMTRNSTPGSENGSPDKLSKTADDGSNFNTEIKEQSDLLPFLRIPGDPETFEDVEELKHKQASARAAEASCPIKPTASPIFQTPGDSAFKSTKEPIFKIASEAPVMQNGNEMMFKGASKCNEEPQLCKIGFDEFLKQRSETTDIQNSKSALNDTLKWKSTEVANKKATEVLMKSAELFSNKDMPKNAAEMVSPNEASGKKSNFIALAAANAYVNNNNNNNTTTENISFRKPQQKGISNVDQKMLEFLKNANSQKSLSGAANKSNDNTCSGHACGHKCKQEEDKLPADAKKHSCQDACEHHKESRKCDCAYCEVFGASLPSHTHKTNETRDRLRTRLNQRKEKVNESVNKGVPKTSPLNAKLASKNNGSLNCTIKITGSSKISMLNGKTVNVSATSNAKVNVKPTIDTEARVPPRVPEVVHPVPPPLNTKPVLTPIEPKKPPVTNVQIPNLTIQKPSVVTSVERPESDCQPLRPSSSLSSSSLNSDNVDSRDINELLNYIEGNKTVDKAALAQKKAAKKARQRTKKAQERERAETEKRLKEEARLREEKRKEEERLKAEALARQLAEKQKKNKKHQEENKVQQQKQDSKKNKKKSKTHDNTSNNVEKKNNSNNLIEETIPAMVTIKRVSEGSNSPATVTITLKGSTPESDKLLFTLVNGHNNKEQLTTATINTDKPNKAKSDSTIKIQSQTSNNSHNNHNKTDDNQKNSKKKKKKEPTSEVASKELKVTIAVDKNNVAKKANASNKKNVKVNEIPKVPDPPKVFKPQKIKEPEPKVTQVKTFVNSPKEDINLPMLRLPPGITITKIEGPPANRNCRVSSNHSTPTTNTPNSNVPVSKSGVIVVDTEKLIQQSITASNNKRNKKKNKKKRDQKANSSEPERGSTEKGMSNSTGSSMVTLKNPIFHTLQTALSNKVVENQDLPVFPNNQQASIFKSENGMVTIRSPRLQNSYENGSPISNFLSDLKPVYGSQTPSTPYVPMCHTNFPESSKNSPFNAQEILSGLPGIEITKVDKNISKNEPENKKASQPAEVSIIPTSNGANGADKFNLDRDDWPFESVFTPRDVLEEDMDAEERELEAFKRFCQQSIPPERKEKVAHLNVKDIILNKKRDVTYS